MEIVIDTSIAAPEDAVGKRRWTVTVLSYTVLFVGLAAVAWATRAPLPLPAILCTILLGCLLIYGATVDSHRLYIPDRVSLGLFPLGLAATWLIDRDAVLTHAIAGAAAGALVLIVGRLYAKLRGRSGIGMGDAKLFASAGAWLGPAGLPSVMLIGCLTAIAALLWRGSIRKRSPFAIPVAFGPHLSLGIWIVWVFGPIFWT